MTRFCVILLVSLAGFSALPGCVSVRSSHGYVLERGEDALTADVGLDTKESVLAKYGEPSMIGTFDPDAWYYLSSRDATRAFFKPKTQAREVVAFQFDDEGVVDQVDRYTLDDAMKIDLVNRKTPTRGKELGFWEQLIGNVGQLPAQTPGGPPQ